VAKTLGNLRLWRAEKDVETRELGTVRKLDATSRSVSIVYGGGPSGTSFATTCSELLKAARKCVRAESAHGTRAAAPIGTEAPVWASTGSKEATLKQLFLEDRQVKCARLNVDYHVRIIEIHSKRAARCLVHPPAAVDL
jgi:hypothetical protein